MREQSNQALKSEQGIILNRTAAMSSFVRKIPNLRARARLQIQSDEAAAAANRMEVFPEIDSDPEVIEINDEQDQAAERAVEEIQFNSSTLILRPETEADTALDGEETRELERPVHTYVSQTPSYRPMTITSTEAGSREISFQQRTIIIKEVPIGIGSTVEEPRKVEANGFYHWLHHPRKAHLVTHEAQRRFGLELISWVSRQITKRRKETYWCDPLHLEKLKGFGLSENEAAWSYTADGEDFRRVLHDVPLLPNSVFPILSRYYMGTDQDDKEPKRGEVGGQEFINGIKLRRRRRGILEYLRQRFPYSMSSKPVNLVIPRPLYELATGQGVSLRDLGLGLLFTHSQPPAAPTEQASTSAASSTAASPTTIRNRDQASMTESGSVSYTRPMVASIATQTGVNFGTNAVLETFDPYHSDVAVVVPPTPRSQISTEEVD